MIHWPRAFVQASIFVTLLGTAGCRQAAREAGSLSSATGIVHTVGNEPFVKIALMLRSDSLCYLSGDSTVLATLLSQQGRMVKVWYDQSSASPEGMILTVIRAEILEATGDPD